MTVGSEDMVRTWSEEPRARRRCTCCGRRASHIGLGGGVGLMSGCEWRVKKWCQDPRAPVLDAPYKPTHAVQEEKTDG